MTHNARSRLDFPATFQVIPPNKRDLRHRPKIKITTFNGVTQIGFSKAAVDHLEPTAFPESMIDQNGFLVNNKSSICHVVLSINKAYDILKIARTYEFNQPSVHELNGLGSTSSSVFLSIYNLNELVGYEFKEGHYNELDLSTPKVIKVDLSQEVQPIKRKTKETS